jgi:hypothetical protein
MRCSLRLLATLGLVLLAVSPPSPASASRAGWQASAPDLTPYFPAPDELPPAWQPCASTEQASEIDESIALARIYPLAISGCGPAASPIFGMIMIILTPSIATARAQFQVVRETGAGEDLPELVAGICDEAVGNQQDVPTVGPTAAVGCRVGTVTVLLLWVSTAGATALEQLLDTTSAIERRLRAEPPR